MCYTSATRHVTTEGESSHGLGNKQIEQLVAVECQDEVDEPSLQDQV